MVNTQPVQLKNSKSNKKLLIKDYFRRIGWVELFNIKIN
jgi:hypothetical protein